MNKTKSKVVSSKTIRGDSLNIGSRLKNDGWGNVLTLKGTSQDKRTATKFNAGVTAGMSFAELADLYVYNGFMRRIIDLIPAEMLRAGFCVSGDEERHIESRFEELKASKVFNEALCWNRLYGGSIIFMGINDGQVDLTQPVNKKNIQEVMFLKAFDRYRINYSQADYYNDPSEPKYGQVRIYNISPIGLSPFSVHESRVLRFDGETIPEELRVQNQGWGGKTIDRIYESVRALGNVYDNVELITEDFIQSTLQISNLGDLIASGREEEIKKRLNIMDLSRHILNTLLLDKDEIYTKSASTVTGLPDVIDRFIKAVSFAEGIPASILLGEEPAGLNSNGDSQLRQFYDRIHADQTNTLNPVYEKLFEYFFLEKNENEYNGIEPEDWSIAYNKLWEPSAKEDAETKRTIAETDNIYITNGTLTPEEVAISRWGSGVYSPETVLQTERMITPPEEPTKTTGEEGEPVVPANEEGGEVETETETETETAE